MSLPIETQLRLILASRAAGEGHLRASGHIPHIQTKPQSTHWLTPPRFARGLAYWRGMPA